MAKQQVSPPAVPFDGIRARVAAEPRFRRALLTKAVAVLLAGELDVARNLFRHYINGTVGFESLARTTGIPNKSLVRMFGPNGNPTLRNFSTILVALQRHENVRIQATLARAS